jgi:hypothetical protein
MVIYRLAKVQIQFIKFSFVPLEKAVSMCMDNTICVNGTVAAILKTARIYGV